jgi:hypothetical protein
MPTTFQKRQKEMKRLEKRRMKEERRAQKKLDNQAKSEAAKELPATPSESESESGA